LQPVDAQAALLGAPGASDSWTRRGRGRRVWQCCTMASASGQTYLLGAGFSKAVSRAMPSMLELGELLRGTLETAFGASDWRVALGVRDFENLLGLLSQDQPWLDDVSNLRNRAAFLEVSRAIAGSVRARQVQALTDSQPDWLRALVRYWLAHHARVLTFNYDTLIEKAVVSQAAVPPQTADDYAHADLYPVAVPAVEHRSSAGPTAPLPMEGMRLTKLHGSLNWYYSGAETFFGEAIYDVGIRPEWGSSSEDKFISKAHYVMDKVPLIVPPTASKNAYFANEAVRGNWRSARAFLESASELVVIGYSMPLSDLMVRGLLTAAGLHRIRLVDVDPGVRERYESLFPHVEIDSTYVIPGRNPLELFVADLESVAA
jgi:hypothetical protein